MVTVQNIASVPSGKIVTSHKGNYGEANLNGDTAEDRFECVASLPTLDCSGVLLAQRWLLTLSECAKNFSNIKTKILCKEGHKFSLNVINSVSRGHFSLLYLERVPALARTFNLELPQNPDDVKRSQQDGIVSIMRKQTNDIIAEPVFVDKCPLKDGYNVNEGLCLASKGKKSFATREFDTGLPITVTEGNGARIVVALLEKASRSTHRERRELSEDSVIGRPLTTSVVKWIRKVRSVDGKFSPYCLM